MVPLQCLPARSSWRVFNTKRVSVGVRFRGRRGRAKNFTQFSDGIILAVASPRAAGNEILHPFRSSTLRETLITNNCTRNGTNWREAKGVPPTFSLMFPVNYRDKGFSHCSMELQIAAPFCWNSIPRQDACYALRRTCNLFRYRNRLVDSLSATYKVFIAKWLTILSSWRSASNSRQDGANLRDRWFCYLNILCGNLV